MKKKFIHIISLLFVLGVIWSAPPVIAASTYEVTAIKTGGETEAIGTYNDYNTARNAMLSYPSTESKVAVIKENGEIINARYAIVRFKYDTNNPFGENPNNQHRLFANANDSSEYTSIHAAYGNDAAFIDYDPNVRRAKIKISGYTGFINRGYYTIVPTSMLDTGRWVASEDSSWFQEIGNNQIKQVSSRTITIRSGPGTNYSSLGTSYQGNVHSYSEKTKSQGYTWYKIGTGSSFKTYYKVNTAGELIHYFASASAQWNTNLGKAPSFLKQNTEYYSFDGNYFYESLTSMLDDYRNNTFDHSINSWGPYYPYYLYVSNHSRTSYTANDFNQIIINRGYNSTAQSKMYGEGANFILSQERYGVNALLTFSAAINESAAGTSAIAMQKNNLFGHNAYGNDPFANATTYNTVADGIMAHASMTGAGYNNPSDYRYYGGHYGNKQSGMNVKYATDPYWGEKAAQNAYISDKSFGLQEWNGSTVGIKASNENVPIKKSPDDNATTIYTLKNNTHSVSNMPVMVFDKVYSNGKYWYKVYTDASLDDNQNITTNGYNFDKSYGYIEEKYLYVVNQQPIIIANDRKITKGENIDLMAGVIATDPENGNITSSVTISGEVYINVPGEYRITYTAVDAQQFRVSKTITVTVTGESIPSIEAEDQTVTQYTSFDPMKKVKANDSIDGDITSKVTIISNTVDINKVGTYKVKYKVTNSTNKIREKEITVQVIANEKPVIEASNRSIQKGSTFNPLEGVKANDKEDGVLSSIEVIENTVDTNKLGTYKVTFRVKDSAGQVTTKTITVTVDEKVVEKREGRFYLEYLKVENGSLMIKGYHTINGIDNDLNTDIQYELVLINQQTSSKYTTKLARLMNTNEMTMPISSPDGKNYQYSWFKSKIDIDSIPEGDYTAYIKSSTADYYSESIMNNILLNEQITNYDEKEKNLTVTNDYFNSEIPMNFIVRKEKIGEKQTKAETNQYTYLDKLELNNNKLHIKAASYSVGVDMRSSASIERKVIFENVETFKKYKYDVGYLNAGTFTIKLITADAFGIQKERAWFEKELDISSLPKGKYAIYITNDSNISDYGEMNDLLFTDLTKANGKIGEKQYTFTLNEKLRNRIELIVK